MTAALVWGRIWRYALGEYGKCTASQETIATALKMSRTTVNRHIKDLLKAGYIEQINPPNGRTNHYVPTDKQQVGIYAKRQQMLQNETADVENSYSVMLQNATADVAESYTKKQYKRQDEETSKETIEDWGGASPRDLLHHPSNLIYQHLVHSNIQGNQRKKVANKVGTHPQNLEAWGRAVSKWIGKGYNPKNIDGILEWLRKETGATDSEKYVKGQFAEFIKS